MKPPSANRGFTDVERTACHRLWLEETIGPCLAEARFEPCIDVFETGGEIVVKMEIPGMRRGDISVGLEGNTLSIRGRREDRSRGRKERYYQMEIEYGVFERLIRIDAPVRRSAMTVFYRDGFLEVRLPRSRARGGAPVGGE